MFKMSLVCISNVSKVFAPFFGKEKMGDTIL